MAITAIINTTTLPSSIHAVRNGTASSPPAAATISGEGVSPAASAAASGSPPGNDMATAMAEAGRCAGSFSRQRRMARSTAGSVPAMPVTLSGRVLLSVRMRSATLLASKARLPVKIS